MIYMLHYMLRDAVLRAMRPCPTARMFHHESEARSLTSKILTSEGLDSPASAKTAVEWRANQTTCWRARKCRSPSVAPVLLYQSLDGDHEAKRIAAVHIA